MNDARRRRMSMLIGVCAALAFGCHREVMAAAGQPAEPTVSKAPRPELPPRGSNLPVEPPTAKNAGARQCTVSEPELVWELPKTTPPATLPPGTVSVHHVLSFGTVGGLVAWEEASGLRARMLTPAGRPTGSAMVLNEMPYLAPMAVVPADDGFFVLSRRREFYFDKCKTRTFQIGRRVPPRPRRSCKQLVGKGSDLLSHFVHLDGTVEAAVRIPRAGGKALTLTRTYGQTLGLVVDKKRLVIVSAKSRITERHFAGADLVVPVDGYGEASFLLLNDDTRRLRLLDMRQIQSFGTPGLGRDAAGIHNASIRARRHDGEVFVAWSRWLRQTQSTGVGRLDRTAQQLRPGMAPPDLFGNPVRAHASETGLIIRQRWSGGEVGDRIPLAVYDPSIQLSKSYQHQAIRTAWTGSEFALAYVAKTGATERLLVVRADCSLHRLIEDPLEVARR